MKPITPQSPTLGCAEIMPSVKWLAPEAISEAKLQVFTVNGQMIEIN